MSAIEGSAFQLQQEIEKKRRAEEVARIQCENPWLSPLDCEAWQRAQEKARQPPPKCCPCKGRGPGIVRHPAHSTGLGYELGPCKCGCHEPRKRGEG